MNQLPPSSFFDLNEDHHDHHDHVDRDHLFNLNTQGEFFYTEPQQGFQFQPPLKADHKIVSSGGSCDHHNPRAEETESDNNDLKLRIWRNDSIDDDHHHHHEKKHTVTTHDNNYIDSSVKWTSSKMRMMRKMIITNPDQPHHNHNHDHVNPIIGADHDDLHIPQNFLHRHHDHDRHRHRDHHQIMKDKHTPMTTSSSPLRADHSSSSSSNIINNINGTIRVCSDCNTTKTPLWRSGPRGPKSLCNACGIRQRKARRAMAAAAANGGVVATEANSSLKSPNSAKIIQHKEKKPKATGSPQFKKRCKLGAQPRGRKKLLCTFEDLRISISKNSAFNRVFPQDEKDAAILLMALSYGLVQG